MKKENQACVEALQDINYQLNCSYKEIMDISGRIEKSKRLLGYSITMLEKQLRKIIDK